MKDGLAVDVFLVGIPFDAGCEEAGYGLPQEARFFVQQLFFHRHLEEQSPASGGPCAALSVTPVTMFHEVNHRPIRKHNMQAVTR
jgi:hypothetical protein